jgi:hypothetical protein
MGIFDPTQSVDIPINIGLPEAIDEQPVAVDVAQSDSPAPISAEVAEQRASKIKYGLNEVLKKSKEEIFSDLQQGKEGELRLQAASEIDQRKRTQTEAVIQHVIGQKGGPLTFEESSGISQIIQNMSAQTDPDSVFEEAYGKQFIGTLDRLSQGNPDSVLNAAKREDPARVAEMQEQHSSLITKREYARKVAEDINAELKQQGWGGYLFDVAKQGIPGYTDYNLRNTAGQGFWTGLGLGPNMEAARKTLLGLPFEEYKAKMNAVVAGLKTGVLGGNPQLAEQFAQSVVEMSANDVFINSSILPLDVTGIGIGKATVKGLEAVRPASKIMERAEKAIKDVSREAANPNASKSTIEAAAGDLKESAVTRATSNLTWQTIGEGPTAGRATLATAAEGGPQATTKAIEALPETMRTDLSDIRNNPGRLGQDLVNRIEESSNTITSRIMDAVRNIQKIERLPDIMTNETAVRAIQESIKDTYKSLKNAVLDVGKPYKEPVANTYLVDMKIGNNDGSYFKSKEVAENYAKFHGLMDAEVLPGTDAGRTAKAVKEAKYTQNIEKAKKLIERDQARANDPNLTEAKRAHFAEQVRLWEEHIVDQAMERNAVRQQVTVEQQGLGFYVKVTKPINETDAVIRDFIAQTSNTKVPEGPVKTFLNAWVGKVRTPEEVLSLSERQNRLTATYTPSVLFDIMKDNAKTISKISTKNRFGAKRKKWDEFQRVLENGQQIKDPNSTDDVGGYFFKSPGELEEKYLQWFNRLPDEDEIVAYFEFKRGMEIDRIFRNLAEHRNQQRVGAETHRISTMGPDGEIAYSPEFSGVTRTKLSSVDDNILIMKDNLGDESFRDLQRMSVAEKKEYQDLIDKGEYKLIELYRPEARPLNGFGVVKDARIRYVLAKTVETRELDWNQVPRRGGGHVEYDYDHYVKQAKIAFDDAGNKASRAWYEGDVTVMPIQVRAMGEKVAEHLNKVRELLKADNVDAAREYSNKNLHIDWNTVEGWFTAGPDANGKYHDARLSLNEPIRVVRKGESIGSIDSDMERRYINFKDGTREGSLARQSQVEFTTERDAYDVFTIDDVGTRGKPLYSVAQAKLVDPITTMNRGLARIAKSNFLDDYKTMSVEHWLRQAEKYLRPSKSEIWHAPFHAFNEADFRKDAPADIKAALEASRYHTQQLTGTPSTTDALLHSLAQKTYDRLYENFGPKGLVIDPAWMLPKLKDPFGFVRSIVFNMKLGLFNIPQFIVQAGNYANIYGIAGSRYATPGTYAAQLHFWSTINSRPEIINHFDNLATKLHIPGTSQWRPGEFKEAFEELRKTGFGNVGSEYAILDNPMSEKVVGDGVNTFLEWGQAPFKAGERNAKYGAWYTAYKEFRDKNPVGRLTDDDRATILQRADLLNVNMSRASSSAIHQGIWSIPTQFYTYQIRLMELFYGTRLTGIERARLLATNAALYGIPMSAGLTGAPVVDYLRNKALEQDYIVGDNFITSLLMEGVPSMIGAIASGGGDFQKGTFQDVGNRFGTKGLEFLNGLGRSDKGYLDIAGGAAWSVAKSTYQQSDGLRFMLGSMIQGDPEVFPPTMEDAADVFKEVSSVNAVFRTLATINTGRWISKNEAWLADSGAAQGIFSAITGLKDTKINDIQTMTNELRSLKDYDNNTEKMFAQEMKRGFLASKNDKEQAHRYFTRAMRILDVLGYPEMRRTELVDRVMRDNQSILDKVTMDYYVKKVPDSRKTSGWDTMKRQQELKEKKAAE